jgi:hypothetical protein
MPIASKPSHVRESFLAFGAPVIGDEEIEEVTDTLNSGRFGRAPKVARFEADVRRCKGVSHAAPEPDARTRHAPNLYRVVVDGDNTEIWLLGDVLPNGEKPQVMPWGVAPKRDLRA